MSSIATPPLFRNNKEFILTSLFLIAIVVARLAWIYQDYKNIINTPSYYIEAQIDKVYNKKKDNKLLLKLHAKEGFDFYLYSNKKGLNRYDWLLVNIKDNRDIKFLDFLKGFFAKGKIVKVLERGFNPKWLVKEKIDNQHNNIEIKDFYNAIFLAEPINKELRDKISSLGVSHLVALSGFHLGILWFVVFGILYYPYKFLQKRFFPWRHRGIDIGFVSLFILYLYLVFVGFPPALVRAYVMLVVAWIALRVGINIISFRLLAIVFLLILIINPRLIVSLGLLFSIMGVFYIFLILKWFKDSSIWLISLILIPVGVFLLMFPIGHFFFPNTSIWQLSSAILSLLFIPFYPISAIAHIFGYGDIFDKALLWVFNLPKSGVDITIPNALIALYLFLSFASIFRKKIFYITLALATVITTYSLTISL